MNDLKTQLRLSHAEGYSRHSWRLGLLTKHECSRDAMVVSKETCTVHNKDTIDEEGLGTPPHRIHFSIITHSSYSGF